jgi:hypothetical protein
VGIPLKRALYINLDYRIAPLRMLLTGGGVRHATIQVMVERCKSIVDVFLQPEDTHPVETQQFINHPVRKKVSLKTLAKVLSTSFLNPLLTRRSPFSVETAKAEVGRGINSMGRNDRRRERSRGS